MENVYGKSRYTTKTQELNDPFHNAIILRLFKSKKEIDDVLAMIQSRYKEYYRYTYLDNNMKIIWLSTTYLDYLLNGKITDFNDYSDKSKLLSVSFAVAEDFANFMNFVRNKHFQ